MMIPACLMSREFKRGYRDARLYCRKVRHQTDFEYCYGFDEYDRGWDRGVSDEIEKLNRTWGYWRMAA